MLNFLNRLTKNKTYNTVVSILLVLFVLAIIFEPDFLFPVQMPSMENFAEDAQNAKTFAFFGTGWCGHCQRAKPEWDKFKQEHEGKGIKLIFVDCDEQKDLASKHGVESYPTFKYLPNGLSDTADAVEFNGERNADGFKQFLSAYL